jgi:6-phosphogluconolactonase
MRGSSDHPNPAQVLLDPQHHTLIVTEKGTNLIDLYPVANDGSLSGPKSVPSTGSLPFGMAFARPSSQPELIVADGFGTGPPNFIGAITAYRLAAGGLAVIDGPVLGFQVAPCWMVITNDSRFAYTSNADSQAISGYRIDTNGTLSLLIAGGATGKTPADTFPLEEALSRQSRFLYVLDSRLPLSPLGPATLSGFAVHPDGRLRSILDETAFSLPFSAIGLAAD